MAENEQDIIARAEALLSGTSPAPWTWTKADKYSGDYELLDALGERVHTDGSAAGEYPPDIDVNSPDGKLIAASPALVRALIERDKAREAEVKRLREDMEALDVIHGHHERDIEKLTQERDALIIEVERLRRLAFEAVRHMSDSDRIRMDRETLLALGTIYDDAPDEWFGTGKEQTK